MNEWMELNSVRLKYVTFKVTLTVTKQTFTPGMYTLSQFHETELK